MKRRTNKIGLTAMGLITFVMLLTIPVAKAGACVKDVFNTYGPAVKKQTVVCIQDPAICFGKEHALKNTFSKNRKRIILQESDVVIPNITTCQPAVLIEQKTAFKDSFYSLLVVYHFSSRGPPSISC